MSKVWFFLVVLSLWGCSQDPVLPDPRIPRIELPEPESKILLQQVNSLEGEESQCFENFINEYQDKVLQHCQQDGYAENIGGGCYHVVGYSLSDALFLKALESCNVEAQI